MSAAEAIAIARLEQRAGHLEQRSERTDDVASEHEQRIRAIEQALERANLKLAAMVGVIFMFGGELLRFLIQRFVH